MRTALGLWVGMCELYVTGGGRRAALTRAVVFVFSYLPKAFFFQLKTKKGTAVARSVPAAKGRKCKWDCAVAKYALHSDTDFTGCASAKASNLSTNHQCAAHVLRREDLHFSGLQPDGRTADTPLYLY